MKLANFNVSEVEVLDEYGEIVTTLDSLASSVLKISKDNFSKLEVLDTLLDYDLLNFINQHSGMFDSKYADCQLVVKSILRENDTGRDVVFIIRIPSAQIKGDFELSTNKNFSPQQPFKWYFRIHNEDEITYEIEE